jgi:hypothetical protein
MKGLDGRGGLQGAPPVKRGRNGERLSSLTLVGAGGGALAECRPPGGVQGAPPVQR